MWWYKMKTNNRKLNKKRSEEKRTERNKQIWKEREARLYDVVWWVTIVLGATAFERCQRKTMPNFEKKTYYAPSLWHLLLCVFNRWIIYQIIHRVFLSLFAPSQKILCPQFANRACQKQVKRVFDMLRGSLIYYGSEKKSRLLEHLADALTSFSILPS